MCGLASLVLVLLVGASAVDAHSGLDAATPSLLEFDASALEAVDAPPAPAPNPWAWVPLGLVSVTGVAAAVWLRRPPRLAVFLSLTLAVFAGETALHSTHHLLEPEKAERCPVYSASLHVAGLEAGLATPELPSPAPIPNPLHPRDIQWLVPVLDGPPARAPPGLPA
jgi:hypothetical protein